jgi:hypothetical protein
MDNSVKTISLIINDLDFDPHDHDQTRPLGYVSIKYVAHR